ncbi:MAG TPA: PEGA domain-containing protein [Gemmatimonadaceae bacterium]
MLQPTGSTRVMAGRPGGAGADDELLRAVREAAAGQYDILGEMGRGGGGIVIYLARDLATATLVALRLEPDSEGYALTVVRELDASIPSMGGTCPRCGAPLLGWGRFCAQCGSDVSGTRATEPARSREELLEAVRGAAQGEYEILGEMPRAEGAGVVYFARDASTGRIVALRLQKDAAPADDGSESYSLGVTRVMKPLVASMGATYSSPTEVMRAARPTNGADAGAETGTTPTGVDVQPIRAQPSAARATPQEVLLPQEEAPRDEVLPPRPPKKTPEWVLGAIAAVVIGAIALAVFVRVRTSPDGTQARVIPGASDVVGEPVMHAAASRPATTADSGRIQVAATLPRGARATIDGVPVPGGAALALAAGPHVLAVSAPGYVSVSEEVSLGAGQTLLWTPALAPVRTASAPRTTERAAAPAAPAAPAGPRRTRAEPVQRAQAPDTPAAGAPAAPSCASAYDAKRWDAALAACQREAEAGNVAAERNLGAMYDQGLGVSRDGAQAANWFRKAADAGSRDAAYQLGTMYMSGRGVPKDPAEAVGWFRKGALLGDAEAQLQLARAYENGTGVGRSSDEAVTWYTKSAQQGNARAQNYLGWLYGNGRGVSRDDEQAVRWFRKAADQGDAQAQYNLGFMYANGRGVERDEQTAVSWFRKAARQGYADAIQELRQRGITP